MHSFNEKWFTFIRLMNCLITRRKIYMRNRLIVTHPLAIFVCVLIPDVTMSIQMGHNKWREKPMHNY